MWKHFVMTFTMVLDIISANTQDVTPPIARRKKHLSEYIQRFNVTITEAKNIAKRTADQSADVTGEWQL